VGYDPRSSTGVHDKIYHRILAMDDGKTQFYLIASDLCLFSPSVYDEATERLKKGHRPKKCLVVGNAHPRRARSWSTANIQIVIGPLQS
jgi:hypothetical protein